MPIVCCLRDASPTRKRFGGHGFADVHEDFIFYCKRVSNIYEIRVRGTASARGCESIQYSSDHALLKKVVLIRDH